MIAHKVKTYLSSKSVDLSDGLNEKIENANLDAFKVEMTKDGVKLSMPELAGWGETPLEISWMRPLKTRPKPPTTKTSSIRGSCGESRDIPRDGSGNS